MSNSAMQEVLREMADLPESGKQALLDFVHALKGKRRALDRTAASQGRNPALQMEEGLLVFTGEVLDPGTDWVKVIRDERDSLLLQQALGRDDRQ